MPAAFGTTILGALTSTGVRDSSCNVVLTVTVSEQSTGAVYVPFQIRQARD